MPVVDFILYSLILLLQLMETDMTNKQRQLWEERHNKLTVHCLACYDIFQEAVPSIQACPHCNNDDMQQTVYLQSEETSHD